MLIYLSFTKCFFQSFGISSKSYNLMTLSAVLFDLTRVSFINSVSNLYIAPVAGSTIKVDFLGPGIGGSMGETTTTTANSDQIMEALREN